MQSNDDKSGWAIWFIVGCVIATLIMVVAIARQSRGQTPVKIPKPEQFSIRESGGFILIDQRPKRVIMIRKNAIIAMAVYEDPEKNIDNVGWPSVTVHIAANSFRFDVQTEQDARRFVRKIISIESGIPLTEVELEDE